METTTESQRDELARDIFIADNSSHPNAGAEWDTFTDVGGACGSDYAYGIADGLLAAGYGKSRIITTPEEVDALPVGSVVLDKVDTCYRLYRDLAYKEPVWCVVGETSPSSPHAWLPVTVLWEPEA